MKNRYERGIEVLNRTTQASGQAVIDGLHKLDPDLAKYTVEYPYGDIISRTDNMDLKTRELIILGILAGQGVHETVLKAHASGALNAGASKTEIREVILTLTAFAGFPKALALAFAVNDILG